MTGLERVTRAIAGEPVDRLPILPIIHSGLAPLVGVTLGDFFSDARVMADTLVDGCRRFGFDGIHMSMGVTAEAEALGAHVEQPENGAPILREHILADISGLHAIRGLDPTSGGRMPLFWDAVRRVVSLVGGEKFVLANLRGPLLAASQLRGVEQILIDLIDDPAQASQILDFTTDTAARLGLWLKKSGANGLVLGEATCSPNFISPALYRQFVLPRHRRLVTDLKRAGWNCLGLHICGATQPIIEDVISTGADFMDIDYQVSAAEAILLARGRIALRGNLDPSSVFRFGAPDAVADATRKLAAEAAGSRWILSSGCDISPGTPEQNLRAFAEGASGEQ